MIKLLLFLNMNVSLFGFYLGYPMFLVSCFLAICSGYCFFYPLTTGTRKALALVRIISCHSDTCPSFLGGSTTSTEEFISAFASSWRLEKHRHFLFIRLLQRMRHSAPLWDNRAPFHLTKDVNGFEQVVLWNPRGASARVNLHGGQVISWRNHRGEELLFNSSKANFKVPKTVRGGISACFPQFGNCDALEQHGFARKRMWKIDENPPPMRLNDSRGKSYVDLLLKPAEEDLKYWPHSFEFRLQVSLALDGNLMLVSRIRNINGKPFNFSFAYHTYLSVSDISEVRIEGLETLDYLDNLCKRERFTEQGDAITFESEVDRVYLSSAPCVAVLDHEKKRTYVVRKEGLPDVVLWNPWDKKSKAMADFGDSDYKQMLCIDGAAIETGVTLKPGEEWTGQVELAAIPSSFCTDNIHPRLKIF